jgi:hypothetical protein
MPKMPEMSGMHMPKVSHDHPDPDATFGTHGMLLFGEETLYLSHLPMFMPPHNFQVILEVTLNDEAVGRLRDFRAHFGRNGMYTFKPKEFHITDLISRHPGKPARTSFGGTLFRSHFERGGESISKHVKVHVTDVLYFQEIGAASTKGSELGYLLFGKGQEKFLVHRITAPPDFDHVVSVNVTGHEFSAEETHQFTQSETLRGVGVTFKGRPNRASERIKPGETLAGRSHAAGAHQFFDLQVEAVAEIYLEEGELEG